MTWLPNVGNLDHSRGFLEVGFPCHAGGGQTAVTAFPRGVVRERHLNTLEPSFKARTLELRSASSDRGTEGTGAKENKVRPRRTRAERGLATFGPIQQVHVGRLR